MNEDYFDSEENNESPDASIFEEAMERFELSKEAFSDIHKNYIEDIKFGILGEQWEAQVLNARQSEKRTTGVYNKLVPLIRNVVNTALRNPPAIKVHPLADSAKETAKILDGLIKHIQNESNSDAIYNSTLQDAVAGGIGCFEIIIDDKNEIRIKRIVDPTAIFPDPESMEPDFSDMNWLFHLKSISKKQFEKLYPGFDISEIDDKKTDWFNGDSVTIAEYWVKKEDGSVCWYILNGTDIIDSSDSKTDEYGNPTPYMGKHIPYCIVVGEDFRVDGRRHIKSLISDLKDYQKEYNYVKSESIDFISKGAKSPYIVSDKSISPYQQLWKDANKKNTPYLPYVAGEAVPQRLDPPPPPVGFIDASKRLEEDMRQTIGIRDPLQEIPASNSGKAIQLQMAQSNVSTYVWQDHLNRAIKLCGKIIVDLIPHFYNYPHIQQILGIDGNVSFAKIQTPYIENGQPKLIDLSGEFGITISTGASYVDQRKETYDNLIELAKIDPRIMQFAGDIILRQMDFAESNEIADRFAATLPPQILAVSKLGNEQQMKQQLMAQNQKLEQAMEMINKLSQTLQAKNQEVEQINSKLQDKSDAAQIKAESDMNKQILANNNDMEKAQLESQTKIAEANINADKEFQIKQLELQIEALKASQNNFISF